MNQKGKQAGGLGIRQLLRGRKGQGVYEERKPEGVSSIRTEKSTKRNRKGKISQGKGQGSGRLPDGA